MIDQPFNISARSLPVHMAPAQLWDRIAQDLDQYDVLTDLPVHAAPEGVWEGIAEELDQSRIRRLPQWRMAAGWGVLLMLVAGLLWMMRGNPPVQQLTVHRVEVPATQLAPSAEGNSIYEEVLLLAENKVWVTEDIRFQRWKAELAELTSVRQELKAALTAYGQDEQLLRQMGQLDRDRDRIVRNIASLI